MSQRELDRFSLITRLLAKEVSRKDAASLLHLTPQHVTRLKEKVRRSGASGLIHGNRGKPGNHRIPEREQDRIIQLLHQRYAGFKPTFAAEKLLEVHGIDRDPKTVRSIMVEEGLWKLRRAQGEHRMWRERRASLGELVQFDGSYHDWFEDRAPTGCLLAAIDDATGKILKAQFAAHEGVVPVFTFWNEYLQTHGKPRQLYLDRFSTYKMTQQVAVENHDLQTQFGRAMKELSIEPIFAYSPQAKGRVERLFGTLQDRLVKELRLAKISDPVSANRFLAETFIPKFNARFSVAARSPADLHRRLTAAEVVELPATFSRKETRVIQNDYTLSFKSQWYQLTEAQAVTVCKKDVVMMEERLDGSVWIRLRGKYLAYRLLPERPKKAVVPWVLPKTTIPWKPPADHPWRQPFLKEAAHSHL